MEWNTVQLFGIKLIIWNNIELFGIKMNEKECSRSVPVGNVRFQKKKTPWAFLFRVASRKTKINKTKHLETGDNLLGLFLFLFIWPTAHRVMFPRPFADSWQVRLSAIYANGLGLSWISAKFEQVWTVFQFSLYFQIQKMI